MKKIIHQVFYNKMSFIERGKHNIVFYSIIIFRLIKSDNIHFNPSDYFHHKNIFFIFVVKKEVYKKKIITCCWEDEVGVVDPKFPVLLFGWIFIFELGLILRVEFWAGELPVPLKK